MGWICGKKGRGMVDKESGCTLVGVENEGEGWGVETGGGDGSETGLVTKKGEKNRQPVSVLASPQTI